jgi:PAS domain S-box-containing protein/putative nucleotidyltransferase with HDIG domain
MPQGLHRSNEIERILELETLLRQHEQKEEQLRRALGHFHQLLESAPEVIYTLSRDGSITSLNPAFEAITGWSVREWLGKPNEGLIHPDDVPAARAALAGVLRGGPDRHVLRIRCRDGSCRTGEFTIRPLKDGDAVTGWFGIVRDVTARLEAEEALRAREAEFRRLFEEAPIGIFRSSEEGKPLMVNPAMVRMLGYDSEQECLARDIEAEGYPADAPRDRFKRLMEERGEVRGFETKWLRKDGTVLHARENARAVRDASGRVTGYEGTVEDISATVEAQAQLCRTLDELQALFRAMPDLYFRLSLDGIILDCLAGRSDDLHLPPEAFLGKRMQEVLPPAVGARFAEALEAMNASREMVTIEYALPFPEGERHFETRLLPLQNGQVMVIAHNATERKRAERALVESEERFRQVTEASLVGVYLVQDGKFRYVNPAFEKIFGYRAGEIEDRLASVDLTYPEDRALVERQMEARLSGAPEAGRYIFRGLRKDGTVIHCEVFSQRVEYHGRPAIIGTVLDITEKIHFIEALQTSEARFRAIIDLTPSLAVEAFDREGRVLLWNSAAERLYGWTEGEMAGRTLEGTLLDAASHAAFLKTIRDLEEGRIALWEGEYPIRKRDGSPGTVASTIFPIPDARGGRQFICMDIDVTAQKRAEEELRRTTARLQLQFDRMPIGCILWDPDFRVVSWNPAAERIFGFAEAEVLGRHPHEFIVPREVRPHTEGIMARLLKGDEGASSVNENITWDGRTILCQWTNTPLKEPDGTVLGVLSMVEDITDRRKAEAALQESVSTLRRTLSTTITTMAKIVETKDPYTAGHQLRVAELAELIAREMGLSPERVQGLHMAAMIHDIGKIYIPAEILSKPGQLTRIEIDMIRTHPNFGAEVLKAIPFPWPIADMILQHHERLDGSGYPKGLKGAEILLEARILCVADVVEAMATHRPYRAARGLLQALQEVQDFRGRYYDPDVVDACLTVIRQGLFSVDGPPAPR